MMSNPRPLKNHPSGFYFERLEGKRFGKLTVDSYHGRDKDNAVLWLCECDCGNVSIATSGCLNHETKKSCGCLLVETAMKLKKTHGGSGEKLYSRWEKIRGRCNNKKLQEFANYGGRGITICEEWNDYSVFRDWANKNGYEEHLTIERINVNGNYCPENCTWIPKWKQNDNRRNTIYYEVDGFRDLFYVWCEKFGINYATALQRFKKGKNPFSKVNPDKRSSLYKSKI